MAGFSLYSVVETGMCGINMNNPEGFICAHSGELSEGQDGKDSHIPYVRLINAGQHIHQRGFARAVFAKQGQNFALADVQIDPIVGDHRAEALCQPV